MATKKSNDANASSSSTKNQTATVKGFNLIGSKDKWYIGLYTSSKETALLGPRDPETMRFARELIGCTIEYVVVEAVKTEKREYNKVAIVCIS